MYRYIFMLPFYPKMSVLVQNCMLFKEKHLCLNHSGVCVLPKLTSYFNEPRGNSTCMDLVHG